MKAQAPEKEDAEQVGRIGQGGHVGTVVLKLGSDRSMCGNLFFTFLPSRGFCKLFFRSFLTCTLFLRRAASSHAHDGYWAGSRDAPPEDGHAARRSLKSGQGPSRLLRPGEGKEVTGKASKAAAQQAGPSVDISTSKGRAKGLRRGSSSGTREEAEKRGGL